MLLMLLIILAAPEPAVELPIHPCAARAGDIVIDGRLDDEAWSAAKWTDDFVDIEGRDRPAPPQRTRAKLLWDDQHLYIAAELDEADVRAEMVERDDLLFLENAFEIFFDPQGDAQQYLELQINARGTIYDLTLSRPYREGGKANAGWNIEGLQSAVHVDGTLNEAGDSDKGWTAELAIPWSSLREIGIEQPPQAGSRWRMNLARVSYARDSDEPAYRRVVPAGRGQPAGAAAMGMAALREVTTPRPIP